MPRPVILLGPQRFRPSVRNTVRSLNVDGPVATVTAGWREREPDDAELDGLLDGRSRNLGLYGRWLDVHERDPELAAADRKRREVLDELQAVYVLRVEHAVETVQALLERDIQARVAIATLDDAIEALRTIDDRHFELIAEVNDEFFDVWQPHARDAVAHHRAAVEQLLDGAGALCIAGGHVDALSTCLHLFNVAAALTDQPVVGWSAGAMVLTERVVLFNDMAPDVRAYAEVFSAGLSLCDGIVAFPHARRRLRLSDPLRVMLLARRFAPATCVLLDDGARLDCRDDGCCPPGTRVLTADGRVEIVADDTADAQVGA